MRRAGNAAGAGAGTATGVGGRSRAASAAERGAVTIESAIALPVFLCVVVAIGFLLRCVAVQERIQHAISQAALEIAGTSYLYGISGLMDIQHDVEGVAGRAGDKVKETIAKKGNLESWLPEDVSGVVNNQIDFATSMVIEGVNSLVFSQYARLVTRKYLTGEAEAADGGGSPASAGGSGDAGDALRGTNIVGGESGLNYGGSTFLTGGEENVTIRVRYKFRIPIFIRALSEIEVTQEACARAWLFGAGSAADQDDGEEAYEEDIWSLGNFERGRRIRAEFHANLPDNFPTIASFSDGAATMIHSLDTTTASYQTPEGIERRIMTYVDALERYNGQPTPYAGTTILPEEIRSRRLVLVVPRNETAPEINAAINRCITDALGRGVVLQVEYYGKKQTAEVEQE
ncbi:MAG: hypothetical protein LBU58_04550 [Clostridiales bacterium]|nr:hypothetical protein [Clostridiales bacterium]